MVLALSDDFMCLKLRIYLGGLDCVHCSEMEERRNLNSMRQPTVELG